MADVLTREEIEALKPVVAAATPGPWIECDPTRIPQINETVTVCNGFIAPRQAPGGRAIEATTAMEDATYIATFDPTLTARLIETALAAMDERDDSREAFQSASRLRKQEEQRAEAAEAERDALEDARERLSKQFHDAHAVATETKAENARLRAQVEADGHDAAYWRQALRDYVVEVRHPLPMILHCPQCHLQHIDVDDESGLWATERHHRKHLCKPEDGGCGHIWQPATVYTVGVAALDAATTEG